MGRMGSKVQIFFVVSCSTNGRRMMYHHSIVLRIFTECLKVSSVITDMVLTLLHSERPKLCAILAFLSAIGLKSDQLGSGNLRFHSLDLCMNMNKKLLRAVKHM